MRRVFDIGANRGIVLRDVIELLKRNNFHDFYYICAGGFLALDSENVLEHEQYSNIPASKFIF